MATAPGATGRRHTPLEDAQGLGIGVMPQAVARSVAGGARFARVPIEGDWARRQFVLCHRPLGALSRAAQSLIGVLAYANRERSVVE